MRDRDHATVTPSINRRIKHVEMTAEIRKRVLAVEGLSMNGRNVKIVTTNNGHVTLRGPVKNVQEKEQIGSIAAQLAGADHVSNQMEIETSP